MSTINHYRFLHRFRQNTRVLWLLGLLAMAVVFRLWVLMSTTGVGYAPTNDDALYEGIGKTLAQTGRYALYPGSPPTAVVSPLLPLLLAAIYWLWGYQQPIAQGIVLLLSALVAPLTLLLGEEIADRRAGVLAGLWIAVEPFAAVFAPLFFAESLFSLLFTTSVLLLLRALRRPKTRRLIPLGVALGLCALARPNGLVVGLTSVALLLLVGRGRWPRRLRQAAIVLATILVIFAPWVVRNFLAFDRFIPTTSDSGRVLVGVYNETCLKYRCLDWVFPEMLPELEAYDWENLSEMERNDLGTALAISYLGAHASEFLDLMPGKLGHFWTQDSYLLQDEYPFHRPDAFSLFQNIYYWPLFVAGLLGLVVLSLSGRRTEFIVLTTFVTAFSLAVLLTWGDARIRIPLHPLLAVSASFLFVTVYDRISGRAAPQPRRP